MSNVWDYLMRRKLLFLALIAIFVTGYVLASLFLSAPMNKSVTNSSRPAPEVSEQPQTKPIERLIIPVVEPDSPEAILTDNTANDEIAVNVPLTGGNTVGDLTSELADQLTAWQSIAFSTTFALLAGAVAITILHFSSNASRIKS